MSKMTFQEWKKRLADLAKAKKEPILGQYELTSRCNLDCKMCYVHNQNSNSCKDQELSTEQWKHIFDQAFDMGLLFATFTGGECLLRHDFKELYLHLWKKRVYMGVLTNGTLISEDYINFFRTYKPECIQISLYGSNEEGYIRVTGHQGFHKTVSAIRRLMDAGINVRVAITPSAYMGDDYINIVRFCKEQGFNVTSGEIMLFQNRDDPDKNDYYLSSDQIVDLSIRRGELYGALTTVDELPDPHGPMNVQPKQGLTCSGGNCLAYVLWDGTMYPCSNAMVGGGASLREMSYADAWKKTVAAAEEVMYGSECEGCPYDEVCPKCPAVRLTDLHRGHCNPAVCELTRNLVAAGVKKLGQKAQSCED